MQALPGDPMPEEQALATLPGVPPRTAVRLLVEGGGWRDITATHYPDPVNLRQILRISSDSSLKRFIG